MTLGCDHTKRNTRILYMMKARNTFLVQFDLDGEIGMAALHHIERGTPVRDGCLPADLGTNRKVIRHVPIFEPKHLLNVSKRPHQCRPLEQIRHTLTPLAVGANVNFCSSKLETSVVSRRGTSLLA